VRQQDTYPANSGGGQLQLWATPPAPFFKGNISATVCFYLAYSKLLKLTAALNAGGVWKNSDS